MIFVSQNRFNFFKITDIRTTWVIVQRSKKAVNYFLTKKPGTKIIKTD